ncbi:MAG: hypothetical protein AMXMBFR64_19270 [Myxococcales bacterium]
MGYNFRTGSLLCRVSEATAAWLARRSLVVLALAAALTAGLAPFAARVGMDDDVVKFLPEGDPDVVRFTDIGARFHGLSIAIIGVEAPTGDVFTAERLGFLRGLTRALRDVPGVGYATGLTELRDVAERPHGEGEALTVVADLIGELPAPDDPGAAAVLAEMRERVLSRDHIAGALLSTDGTAAILLATLAPDARVTDTANAIRALAERMANESGSDLRLRYGGAPFIGAYVAEGTQRDLKVLAPYVCGAVLVLVFFSFRSVVGMALAVASILLGIAWTMGLMGIFGRDFTLVSSSMPVLLMALGSAYSIHVLTRVLSVIDSGAAPDRRTAVRMAVADVGPPVFAAGLTTALAFLSFLVMDIAPMREFGLWMAAGTMAILYCGLLVVPAAVIWLPLKPRAEGRAPEWLMTGLIAAARRVARDRRLAFGALLAIGLASAAFLPRLTTHMDTKSFFSEGSEPLEAEHFLEKRLGGSLFVQVEITGDIRSAMTLRQIDRIAAYAGALQDVTDVQSVAAVIALAGQALSGEKRIPADLDGARALTVLADDDPNLRLLVDTDWKHALVQVKVGGFDTERAMRVARAIGSQRRVLGGVRVAVPRGALDEAARLRELGEVTQHVANLLTGGGRDVELPKLAALVASLAASEGGDLLASVTERLRGHIADDELIYLREGASVDALAEAAAKALAAGTLTPDALWGLVEPLASDEDRADPDGLRKATDFLHGDLSSLLRSRRQATLEAGLKPLLSGVDRPEVREAVARAAGVLLDPVAFLPAEAAPALPVAGRTDLDIAVSGYPVLYAGMNRSVQMNQIWSTLLSFVLVGLALAWVYRSALLSFVAVVPAGLTLLVAFGLIGAFGLSVDIGTSMISAIAVGVGIDYAVHLLWKHEVPDPAGEEAALAASLRATGWGIIINTLAVTVGFAVLLASTVVPMRRFGILTAACMVVSAVGTLLLVPALTRWVAPAVRRRWRSHDVVEAGALGLPGALPGDDGDRRP